MEILPQTALKLVEKPTNELVKVFKNAIMQTYWVQSSQYDLLERQIQWMLNYSISRPLEDVLTPNRVNRIEAALEKMRKGEIRQAEGWLDIWQAVSFVPTFAIEQMKRELGGLIENI